MLHAPVVVKDGDWYRLIAGAGRCASAKDAGFRKIWVCVLPYEPDSPHFKLAFFDENLMRVQLPPAVIDEQFKARRALIEQIDPSQKPEEKKKAAGSHGVKGGRGKKKQENPATENVAGFRRPSDKPEQKKEREAVHRREGASPDVWELYVEGKLKQSQMDKLVTVKDPVKQLEIAEMSVGKSVAETVSLIKEATAEEKDGKRLVKDVLGSLSRTDKLAAELVRMCEHSSRLLDKLPEGTTLSAGAMKMNLDFAIRSARQLLDKLLGKKEDHNGGARKLLA